MHQLLPQFDDRGLPCHPGVRVDRRVPTGHRQAPQDGLQPHGVLQQVGR